MCLLPIEPRYAIFYFNERSSKLSHQSTNAFQQGPEALKEVTLQMQKVKDKR
jgi:hypothetical protein